MKIIFLGTPEFGADILEKMINGGHKPVLVITNPDKPKDRDKKITESPVALAAKKNKIRVLKPEKIISIKSEIEEIRPDFMILAAYGQLIPSQIIKISKHGILNVHPSLLPKYRGPSPIQYATLNGDKTTGVTIMLLNNEMDRGDIISQEECNIEKENYQKLSKKLSEIGGELLIKTIPKWVKGEITGSRQDNKNASYSKIIIKNDGRIDWKQPAEKIERQIRAFHPWPGSFSFFISPKTKKRTLLKIIESDVQEQTKDGPFGSPGKIYMGTNGNLAVQTGKDFLIVKKMQIEGKKPVKVEDYLRGNIDLIGVILE